MAKLQPFHKFCSARGLTLRPAQRVFSMVAFDGVDPCDLTGNDRDLARAMFGDVETIPDGARGRVVMWKGRDVGGTLMTAWRHYQLALTVQLDLIAGEMPYVVTVGPEMRLARIALNYQLALARQDEKDGHVAILRESADSFVIERLYDNVQSTFEALPASAGGTSVRGRKFIAFHMTESSFFRDKNYVINDAEMWNAAQPKIMLGGSSVSESTLWTTDGLHHELGQKNHGHPDTCIAAICPTLLMRPELQDAVERERERDPDNAAREFDCIPQNIGSEKFFDNVDQCVDAELPHVIHSVPLNAQKGAGLDLGLILNSSACSIVATLDGVTAPLEMVEIRPPRDEPLKLSHVVPKFGEMLARHGLKSVVGDAHLRPAAQEWFDPFGVTIVGPSRMATIEGRGRVLLLGAEAMQQVYLDLRTAMSEGNVRLPANPRLLAQLKGVTARPLSGGGLRIDMPSGKAKDRSHGDLAVAFVNAFGASSSYGVKMLSALNSFNANGGAEGLLMRLERAAVKRRG